MSIINTDYIVMKSRLQELQYRAMEAKIIALKATDYVIRIAQAANVLEVDGAISSTLQEIDLYEKKAVEEAQIKITQATLLARKANELHEEMKRKFNLTE